MSRAIHFGAEGSRKLQSGIDQLANAVKVTLGPRGRNVVLYREYGSPHITKDGVTVAQAIELPDAIENMGAQLVRDVASKTAKEAGDGTTTATVLAQAIYTSGARNVAAGANPMAIKRGIDLAVVHVVAALKELARPVDGTAGIAHVGTISANDDQAIGQLIADAMAQVGTDGIILVEDSPTAETRMELVEGMQFDAGYLNSLFITDAQRAVAEYTDALVLVTDQKVSTLPQIMGIMEIVLSRQLPIILIAEEVTGEALAGLILNKARNGMQVLALRGPGYGLARREMLQDIAALTGATLISDQQGLQLDKCTLAQLGHVAKVTTDADTTTLVATTVAPQALPARIAQLKGMMDTTTNEFDKEVLRERIAQLGGGVAILHVGAASELERGEKKDRIDDALHATRAAVAEGVVPGGGVALLRAQRGLDKMEGALATLAGDEATGVQIVHQALEAPLRVIVANAGGMPDVVVNNVRNAAAGDSDYGYNARTDTYENLLAAGVLDPAKVTRLALENAASVAGLLLTTACVVAPLPRAQERGQASNEF